MVGNGNPNSRDLRMVAVGILGLGGYFLVFDHSRLDVRQFGCAMLLEASVAAIAMSLLRKPSLRLWMAVVAVLTIGLIGSVLGYNKVSFYAATHFTISLALFYLSFVNKRT